MVTLDGEEGLIQIFSDTSKETVLIACSKWFLTLHFGLLYVLVTALHVLAYDNCSLEADVNTGAR